MRLKVLLAALLLLSPLGARAQDVTLGPPAAVVDTGQARLDSYRKIERQLRDPHCANREAIAGGVDGSLAGAMLGFFLSAIPVAVLMLFERRKIARAVLWIFIGTFASAGGFIGYVTGPTICHQ